MNWSNIKEYIGDKALYKSMIRIAAPIAGQSLITVGINLMDTIMLSSMGDAQLSASTLAGNYFMLFGIMYMGIGMGASVLTSRFYGMKEMHSLKQAVAIMLRFSIVLGLVVTLFTGVFPKWIMGIYSNDQAIIEYGATYLLWIFPSFFTSAITTPCTVVLRTVNLMKIPLIASIIAFFVNVFFNWVFIFGNLGMPRMEIAGAALGTLIARIFEVAFIGIYFFGIDKVIGFRIKSIFMRCKGLVREYFKISIPVIISDTLLALGNNILAIIMGHIGSTFVAANSVTTVVQQLSTIYMQGLANSSGIITGHTLGEGKTEKAQKNGYAFFFMGVVAGLMSTIIIFALKIPIVEYYKVSAETKAIAYELMDAIAIIIVFQCVGQILTKGVLRSGGDTKFLMMGDILFLWIASVPLGALAGLVFHWPAFWVYIFLKIDYVIKTIWCFFRLKSGKWMKKIKKSED